LVVRGVYGITQLSHKDNYRRTEVRYDWDSRQIDQERDIDSACHLTVAVSAELALRLGGYGLSSDKIVVIHSGVDIREFTAASTNSQKRRTLKQRLGIPLNKKVVGIIGRLDACKNPFEALHVYSRSTLLKKESVLLYLGDGPLRSAVEAQAGKEAPGLVFFAGEKAFHEVPHYLSLADIVMMLSRTEGLPYVLIEAMAMGIPVVATAVGGIPEVITDQVDGFLCNAGDASAQCALEHLVNDPKSRRLVGSRARNTVRTRFDVRETLNAEFRHFRKRL
jgi:glycosyltransferase involved in cell wall biosynthesis